MAYNPEYDTTIDTVTSTSMRTTVHLDQIDWDFDFEDPRHTDSMSSSEEYKREWVARKLERLRLCAENVGMAQATDYDSGGYPMCWKRVRRVGMVSTWPYWRPRPMVEVDSDIGPSPTRWIDWKQLSGARLPDES